MKLTASYFQIAAGDDRLIASSSVAAREFLLGRAGRRRVS
jgi:hypothetical protein